MPKDKRTEEPTLRQEIYGKFELFIAGQLDEKASVSTSSLAEGFYNKQERLLRKLSGYTIIRVLVRWAEEILKNSGSREAARNSKPQLVLPLNLQGIEVPGAFSFITGANRTEYVANYKAVGWQIQSHISLLKKHESDVRRVREDAERLWKVVEPMMTEHPDMKLDKALERLRRNEEGAA